MAKRSVEQRLENLIKTVAKIVTELEDLKGDVIEESNLLREVNTLLGRNRRPPKSDVVESNYVTEVSDTIQ